jgi:uncharacterized membrane protein YkvI
MKLGKFLQIYVVPAAIFEAIIAGGGYGTGRETVEFITKYGSGGGMLGMLAAAVGMWIVVGLTFELSRRFRVYDYRQLMKILIGRAWFSYEILGITMTLLVLAITGAAAGTILRDTFGIPVWIGVALTFGLIVLLNYYGREVVIKVLSLWVLLLVAVFVTYFVTVARHYGLSAMRPDFADVRPGWFVSACQYVLYNSSGVPIILYAARHIETPRQAAISALVAAILAMTLGTLFHLSFLAAYPAVLAQSLPTHWMIGNVHAPGLMVAYIVALFGAMIKTAVGIVQGVNERLDEWYLEKTGRAMSRISHGLVAAAAIIASGALSNVGVITLVQRGYGTVAWGFLVVFTLPLLTVGVYRIFRGAAPQTAAGG